MKRINLRLPYCGTEMEWVVILDSKEESLYLLAMDIRKCFGAYQIQKIRELGIESIMFNLAAVDHRKDSVEVLVDPTRGTVLFSMPIWDEKDSELSDSKNNHPSPSFLVRGHAIMLYLEFRIEACSSGRPEPEACKVEFPEEMELSKKAFQIPNWTPQTSLFDFLPLLKEIISFSWNLRREFVCSLVHKYAMLEFDAIDYSRCQLLVRVDCGGGGGGQVPSITETEISPKASDAPKGGRTSNKVSPFSFTGFKKKLPSVEEKGAETTDLQQRPTSPAASLVRILQFVIPHNFPDRPPSILIHDNLSQQYWTIAPPNSYNPQWTAEQMAEELYNHACNQIPFNI